MGKNKSLENLPVGVERNKAVDEISDIFLSFNEAFGKLENRFRPSMGLDRI
jgi:hypothetical protein